MVLETEKQIVMRKQKWVVRVGYVCMGAARVLDFRQNGEQTW